MKLILNLISLILVLPFAIICIIEERFLPGHVETLFNMCAQLMAMLPGLPGVFLRRAFYVLTLESCSPHSHIGFGSIFSHRSAKVARHVYIGNYALIGSVNIGEHSLIGSRTSIINKEPLHELDEDGRWTPFSADRLARASIAKNVWIGEGAIIMADIGEGCMVGAGAVVTTNIKPHILVTGNPARFVKNLKQTEQSQTN
jgi:virginiamycin A acetyltransferase